jgi:transposase
MPDNANNHSSTKRYPPELKERAVRMVFEAVEQTGERTGAVSRIARQLGIGDQSLRNWVAQAEVDRGNRAGLTTEERRRMVQLERENKELRRSNEILKSAAAFFARELDPRSTK